jgi:hypothetical protein
VVQGPSTVAHLDSPSFADDLQLVRESLLDNTRALGRPSSTSWASCCRPGSRWSSW